MSEETKLAACGCGGRVDEISDRNLKFYVACECGLTTGPERCAADARSAWERAMSRAPAAGGEERRPGNSRLVYDKQQRTIIVEQTGKPALTDRRLSGVKTRRVKDRYGAGDNLANPCRRAFGPGYGPNAADRRRAQAGAGVLTDSERGFFADWARDLRHLSKHQDADTLDFIIRRLTAQGGSDV